MIKGVRWIFNPRLVSFLRGVYKVMVKGEKKAIRSILGNAYVNDCLYELLSAHISVGGPER